MAGRKRKQPAPPKPKKMQNRQALDSDNVDPVVSSRKRRRGPKLHQQEDEFLSSKMSWKILREALNQQKEIVWEAEDDQKPEFSSVVPSIAFDFDSADDENDRSSESETESDGGEIEIDPEEERILEVFMKKDAGRQLTLGDIIARKIRKKSAEERSKVDQSFIDLYKGVGKLLSRYTVGKLPKALMHIPSMELWEDALQYTEPEKWSPCAIAVLKILADMEYCGTTSYFIKVLLDKQSTLPYLALNAVVAHFMRFLEDSRVMPVIWHQTLLSLVQSYKDALTKEDKDNLDRLLQHQKHYLITPEIRRELQNSRNCGEKNDDLMSISSPMIFINKHIEEDRWDFPEVPMEED